MPRFDDGWAQTLPQSQCHRVPRQRCLEIQWRDRGCQLNPTGRRHDQRVVRLLHGEVGDRVAKEVSPVMDECCRRLYRQTTVDTALAAEAAGTQVCLIVAERDRLAVPVARRMDNPVLHTSRTNW